MQGWKLLRNMESTAQNAGVEIAAQASMDSTTFTASGGISTNL